MKDLMRINFIPQRITKYQVLGVEMKLQNKERIKKVLEIRRSNAATPIPSKKTYSRKRKHKKTAVGKTMNWD
jgi:cobalamin biosynthesis protein CobD/CbiB